MVSPERLEEKFRRLAVYLGVLPIDDSQVVEVLGKDLGDFDHFRERILALL
jgi:hypothetical protein